MKDAFICCGRRGLRRPGAGHPGAAGLLLLDWCVAALLGALAAAARGAWRLGRGTRG